MKNIIIMFFFIVSYVDIFFLRRLHIVTCWKLWKRIQLSWIDSLSRIGSVRVRCGYLGLAGNTSHNLIKPYFKLFFVHLIFYCFYVVHIWIFYCFYVVHILIFFYAVSFSFGCFYRQNNKFNVLRHFARMSIS